MSEQNKTTSIVAHVDGASRGNPGPAAYAVVIETPQGEGVTTFSHYLGEVTNNVAEYNGLLGALRYAVEQGSSRLQVLTDSELMARQIEGVYKVKHPDLKPLYAEAKRLIGRLNSFSIRYVPREQNREADRLCNRTLDGIKRGHPHHEGANTPAKPAQPAPRREDEASGPASVPKGPSPSAASAQSDCEGRRDIPLASAGRGRLYEAPRALSPVAPDDEIIANAIVEAASSIHSELGPGLLESIYEACLAHALSKRGLQVERQVELPIQYHGLHVHAGMRLDMIVQGRVVVEIKSLDSLQPLHTAQMLTYLRHAKLRTGLIINFNVGQIRNGIQQVVL